VLESLGVKNKPAIRIENLECGDYDSTKNSEIPTRLATASP
jgi:hypothetical protein